MRRPSDSGFLAATLLASVVLSLGVLRIWDADLSIPFDYSGDANYTASVIKGVLEHGWHFENPDLGAPSGQELYDFPVWSGDNLQFVVIKALGLVFGDYAVAMNLFFLLGFPLTALSAFLVLRRLTVSAGPALVCSVLFALLPYHFLRGEDHLFLSAYYAVPLGAYLVLSVYGGEPLFAGLRSRRTLATTAICIVIGSAAVYYAAFTLLLLATATLLAAATSRSRRTLATGALAFGLIVGTLAVNFAPNLVHLAANGSNRQLERHPFETEAFSLRLAQLVLPVQNHRLEPLADLKERYEAKVPPSEASLASLGAVASLGFLWLLGVAVVSCVRIGPTQWRLHGHAAAATVIAFLVATTGGFAAAIAYFVTPQLHAWNRISVFIAFFSLLAVGLLLDRLRTRIPPAAFVAVLAMVLTLGALDQTTDSFAPPYDAVETAYESDEDFVESLERRLGPGASVFQLPYVPFPASPAVERMSDYDHLRGYLHSEELRWSYGAMKGRPEDWADDVAAQPLPVALQAAKRRGFDGVWIDRFGYPDAGRGVEAELGGLLGSGPVASSDGRLAFFDLRGYVSTSAGS